MGVSVYFIVIFHSYLGIVSYIYLTSFTAFASRDDIFQQTRDESNLAKIYSAYISQQLSQYSGSGGFNHIGALIMEPGKINHIVIWSIVIVVSYAFGN